MTPWIGPFTRDYVEEVCDCLDRSLTPQAHLLVDPFIAAVTADRATIQAFGNGGSSSIAQTMSWAIREILGPFLHRTRFVGAWDLYHLMEEVERGGFEESAVRLLKRDGAAEPDLIVLISGSGNSRNLVAVARHCLAQGVPVVSLTGRSGGAIGELGVPGLRIDSDDQQIIEDCALAGIYILLSVVASILSSGNHGDLAVAESRDAVHSALRQDSTWVDRVSSALARAATQQRRVNIIAPEGGALGLSAEHIAHNLSWDLRHGIPGVCLSVRSGVSLADYTGMVNDSGMPGMAASCLLDDSGPDDVTVIFAHNADHPAVALVRERARAADLPVHGWYGAVGQPTKNEHVTIVDTDGLLRVIGAQVTGHVLLRAARAKVPRYFGDLIDEESRARVPVAPQACYGKNAAGYPKA
ncbi:MAG: SIS domain-containing protein [Pseudonocardiaceae bacterium]